jgi:heme/copper-type cytochrome/quinol oxidase subunit 2
VVLGVVALLVAGCDEAPMTFMRTFGPAADPITSLGWVMTVICSAVVVVIGALLLGAMWSRASHFAGGDLSAAARGGHREVGYSVGWRWRSFLAAYSSGSSLPNGAAGLFH